MKEYKGRFLLGACFIAAYLLSQSYVLADFKVTTDVNKDGLQKTGTGKIEMVFQIGHSQSVTSLAFSPDGKYLIRRSGAIVFSSSKGGEFSYEDDKIANGYFTEAIMKAMLKGAADTNADGLISTYELRAFVAKDVALATEDLQHPTVDRDNIYQKFGFPVIE